MAKWKKHTKQWGASVLLAQRSLTPVMMENRHSPLKRLWAYHFSGKRYLWKEMVSIGLKCAPASRHTSSSSDFESTSCYWIIDRHFFFLNQKRLAKHKGGFRYQLSLKLKVAWTNEGSPNLLYSTNFSWYQRLILIEHWCSFPSTSQATGRSKTDYLSLSRCCFDLIEQ
jgi:hypothetical protein